VSKVRFWHYLSGTVRLMWPGGRIFPSKKEYVTYTGGREPPALPAAIPNKGGGEKRLRWGDLEGSQRVCKINLGPNLSVPQRTPSSKSTPKASGGGGEKAPTIANRGEEGKGGTSRKDGKINADLFR